MMTLPGCVWLGGKCEPIDIWCIKPPSGYIANCPSSQHFSTCRVLMDWSYTKHKIQQNQKQEVKSKGWKFQNYPIKNKANFLTDRRSLTMNPEPFPAEEKSLIWFCTIQNFVGTDTPTRICFAHFKNFPKMAVRDESLLVFNQWTF